MERQTNRFCFVLYFNLIHFSAIGDLRPDEAPNESFIVSATEDKSKFSKTFYRCK